MALQSLRCMRCRWCGGGGCGDRCAWPRLVLQKRADRLQRLNKDMSAKLQKANKEVDRLLYVAVVCVCVCVCVCVWVWVSGLLPLPLRQLAITLWPCDVLQQGWPRKRLAATRGGEGGVFQGADPREVGS